MPVVTKKEKTKICPICAEEYTPRSTTQRVCHNWKCAIEFTRRAEGEKKAKRERKQIAEERADLKARKEALKSLNDWHKEAQSVFNRYIRLRDANKPCASCGCELKPGGNYLTGSAVDASHYRSRGAASHLRYNVFNVHAACTRCNRQLSGNAVEFRVRLVERIGVELVERLDADNAPRRFTIDYVKRIKSIFTRRAKHYAKIRGS